MKLTEKSMEVFEVIKNNGGRVEIEKICEITGRNARSINANVNDLCSEKKGLAIREKVEVEGAEKPVTYVVLTDAGMKFVPSDEE
jgi:predicted transcriptional regulator